MKKWVVFAVLSAIAGASNAILPLVSDYAASSTLLNGNPAENQSTAAMLLAALGMMVVIAVRRSGK